MLTLKKFILLLMSHEQKVINVQLRKLFCSNGQLCIIFEIDQCGVLCKSYSETPLNGHFLYSWPLSLPFIAILRNSLTYNHPSTPYYGQHFESQMMPINNK